MSQPENEFEPADIDVHIAELSSLVDTVASADQPMVAGLLGELLLDRYMSEGEEIDLRTGLARLHAASDLAGPDHPDTTWWCYLLGVGYGARAARGTSSADWDIAIGWMATALSGAPHEDLDPDATTAELAQLHLLRFYALEPAWNCAAACDAADRLVASLSELVVSDPNSMSAHTVTMLRGLALLARYGARAQDADRDGAIELLETVLPLLRPDIGSLAEAWGELADAHHDRFIAEEDRASLDRSIQAAECALRLTDADSTLAMTLRVDLAVRLEARWAHTSATIDRDRAIEYLADFLAGEPGDPPIWSLYGNLLRARGDANDAVSDLTLAISWLRRAAAATSRDEDDAWLTWYWLGHAYLRRWDVAGEVADRDQLIACFAVSLACGVPEAGLALAAHLATVLAIKDQVEQTPGPTRRSAGLAVRGPFDRAYHGLEECGHGEPAQAAELALLLAYAEVAVLRDPADIDIARVRRVLGWIHRHPAPPLMWAGAVHGLEGLLAFLDQAMSGGAGDFGLARFAAAGRNAGFAEASGTFFRAMAGLSAMFRGNTTGDRARLQAAKDVLGEREHTGSDPEMTLLASIAELMHVHSRGDISATEKATRKALNLASALPDSPMTEHLVPYLTTLSQICEIGGAAPVDAPRSVDLPARTDDTAGFYTPILQLAQVSAAASAAIVASDADGLRVALRRIEEIARRTGPDHPVTPEVAGLLGTVGLQLARCRPHDTAAVDAALHWNTESLTWFSGGEHPLFATAAVNLAEAHRLRGHPPDLARSRELGLAALRGHAYQVLLQSGTEHAIDAARGAARTAYRIAGWCAADLAGDARAADDLVRALDAGRGLVLHAATTSATVADQLTALGCPGLAAEWVGSGGSERIRIGGSPGAEPQLTVPGDLRIRVLQELSRAQPGGAQGERAEPGASGRMFAPPSVDEIRGALRVHGSDALVYLVPASTQCPGMAVLVPRDDPVVVLPMPGLETGPGSALARYACAYQAFQDSTDAEQEVAFAQWQVAFRALGDWAWEAAGRELLAAGTRRCAGPVPRLVLVPVGILAMVAWHAASRPDEGGVRYLAQDAVISSIPSGRLLCDIVDRPRYSEGAALIVGNPTGDLESSGSEAQAIHSAFYPSGRHLGTTGRSEDGSPRRARDGAGSAEELLDWLADETRPRWMLHLACHARTDPTRPTRSVLELAGGPASVAALLDRWPVTRLQLGVVVLSGCTTDVAGESYDEAFSLATAFLALGARSAFGSMWLVEDVHTELFMFMLHHFLIAERCAPADALHRTRLWMLDPHRRAPDTLPAELVCGLGSRTPDDPSYWAGFNHLGV